MKKNILFILLSFPLFAFAQDAPELTQLPIDSSTNLITYKAIVEVPSVKAADIYSRSREWFATAFKSANSVLQMDDKTAGKLIGKGEFKHTYLLKVGSGVTTPANYIIGFTVNVTIKDGKYRVIMTDFTSSYVSSFGGNPTSGTLEALYKGANAYRTSDTKVSKQVYPIFVQLFNDVDTDTKTVMANLQKAVTTKIKDDF